MSTIYVSGNIIEQNVLFTKEDNITPIDPTTVLFKYTILYAESLSGPYTITFTGATVPTTGAISRASTGDYIARVDTSLLPGYWTLQWVGIGGGQAINPTSALVNPTPIS